MDKRAVLISLPLSLIAQLDEAARAFNMPRTDVIRRSLMRDVDYMVRHEVEAALQHLQEREKRYAEWCKRDGPHPLGG
jgi:Ribbon-helix-helix protein, copG family